MTAAPFHVRLWGVRGATPTPCAENLGVGGNTTCLEVTAGRALQFIIDAGSGLRALGNRMVAAGEHRREIHILFTHFHWDHLQGLPFFAPLYLPQSRIVLHSARPVEELQAVLGGQMQNPYFPMAWCDVPAQLEYRQMAAGPQDMGGIAVEWFALTHPQGSVGFTLQRGGKKIAFATDHECGAAEVDRGVCDAARGADTLILDAQYTPQESADKQGWGHSTWLDAARIAREAAVRQLALFHHDPERDDAAVEKMASDARAEFANTIAAREGMVL
jgi:phosphoribosyl 1,2-cyclic phosphodiesterase